MSASPCCFPNFYIFCGVKTIQPFVKVLPQKNKLPFVDEKAKYCHNGCMPGVMMICRGDNVCVFGAHARGWLLITAVSAWYLTLYPVHFPLLQVTWRCLYPVSSLRSIKIKSSLDAGTQQSSHSWVPVQTRRPHYGPFHQCESSVLMRLLPRAVHCM